MNLRNDANDDVSARASPRRAHRDDVAGGDDGSRLLVVVSPRAVDGDGEIRDDGDDDEREDAIEGEDDDADVVDASRLHVLCRAGRVESLFDSAPALVPVVSDDSDDDDEAAFLAAASGALDE